jgi:hypothetical protein
MALISSLIQIWNPSNPQSEVSPLIKILFQYEIDRYVSLGLFVSRLLKGPKTSG